METQVASCNVYVSFRGADTRKSFTDQLYTALYNAGFHTFRDEDEIQIQRIERAIERSSISVIVFSRNYASSRWCLEELLCILERRRFDDCYRVVPTFFDVQPADVGNQKGSFQKAFDDYEKSGEYSKDTIDKWRNALKEASQLAGVMFPDEVSNGREAGFIQTIVKEVGKPLRVLNVASYTVGIESRVEDVDLWLKDPADVGLAVIIGTRGIGKTTIAKVAYNLNIAYFDASSFLGSIREASEQPDGLLRLQSRLLLDISKWKGQKIYTTEEGVVKIQDALCSKRSLVVLDDVDQFEHLDAFIGGAGDSFLKGSKIIITTCREGLLSHLKHKTFRIKQMDDNEALQLFSLHAFKRDHPKEGYLELSKRIVQHCNGLPLAIKVLGSSLSGRGSESWASALNKLEAIPDERIRKTLQVSYNSLHEVSHKRLFLIIASSFVGQDRDHAVTLLGKHGFYSNVGMQSLIDTSLITISKDNTITMHRLVQDMAMDIIRKETPGKHVLNSIAASKTTETLTSQGSVPSNDRKSVKRMRMEDYEDESMPPNKERPCSFKHLRLGFYSLFGPVTHLTRLLKRHQP